MKIKHQLSIATLVMAGVFTTGCSQQSVMGEGASQVAGGQQVAGGSQVAGGQQAAGGSQVAGGQQAAGGSQVAGSQQAAGGSQVAGGQQAAGGQQVADTQTVEPAVPATPVEYKSVPKIIYKERVVYKPVYKTKVVYKTAPEQNCHSHAANSMTNSMKHCHKYSQKNHTHMYGGAAKTKPVDVFALQTKLKAKGYYKGPIDGVVGSGTRAALQQFMQNRN